MSDRIRVMLRKDKMQPIIDRLKASTECNSITHMLHTILEWVDRHPTQSTELREWIRKHDYKKKE